MKTKLEVKILAFLKNPKRSFHAPKGNARKTLPFFAI